jgi:hypothetical protein
LLQPEYLAEPGALVEDADFPREAAPVWRTVERFPAYHCHAACPTSRAVFHFAKEYSRHVIAAIERADH